MSKKKIQAGGGNEVVIAETLRNFLPLVESSKPKLGLAVWRAVAQVKKDDSGLLFTSFDVQEWPQVSHGMFITNDTFVVANTWNEVTNEPRVDVHVWFGKNAVEKDADIFTYMRLLGVNQLKTTEELPVALHREYQGSESALFRSYFRHGFVYIDDADNRPRLYHVRSDNKKHVRATEVAIAMSSLNQGDVFILDLGEVIYVFDGDCSDPIERSKAAVLASTIKLSRGGLARVTEELDEFFWNQLGGGKREDVVMKMVTPVTKPDESVGVDVENLTLYRFSVEQQKLVFVKVHQGRVYPKMLRSEDVYVLDGNAEVFTWIGVDSPEYDEQVRLWLERADVCLGLSKKSPLKATITRVLQGQTNKAFDSVVYPGRLRKGWLARSIGVNETDFTLGAMETVMTSMGDAFHSCTGERDLEDKVEEEWNMFDKSAVELIPTKSEEASNVAKARGLSSAPSLGKQ